MLYACAFAGMCLYLYVGIYTYMYACIHKMAAPNEPSAFGCCLVVVCTCSAYADNDVIIELCIRAYIACTARWTGGPRAVGANLCTEAGTDSTGAKTGAAAATVVAAHLNSVYRYMRNSLHAFGVLSPPPHT